MFFLFFFFQTSELHMQRKLVTKKLAQKNHTLQKREEVRERKKGRKKAKEKEKEIEKNELKVCEQITMRENEASFECGSDLGFSLR